MSASTSASRPDLSAPIWMTMSISVAPSAERLARLEDLGRRQVVAVREADRRADRDVRAAPGSPARDGRRPAGRTPTRRRTRRPAGRSSVEERVVELGPQQRVVDRLGDVAVGQAWRSVSASCSASLDVRAQDVARQQEAALHELVGAFEVAVLVLDDARRRRIQRDRARRRALPSRRRRGRAGAEPASRCPTRRRRARRGPRGRSSGPWPGSGGCAARTRG